ncbi:MAG: tetratricopeptide repeat protein [Xanthomonadales bacterium]|nr:tetratricopeptide repeat protein [Xanthomonadales bacterium]
MSLIAELHRRNVFRVSVGYVVSCWLLAQVADLVLEAIGAPDWAMKTILLVFVLGFPVAVFFSWAFEVTPEGLKRESEVDRSASITHITARKLDWAILFTLAVAIGFYAYDRLVLTPEREAVMAEAASRAEADGAVPVPEGFIELDKSIAVLPFVNMSSEEEQDYFSDGLSEELLNLLAKIPELRVAARTSSFSFKGQNREIPEIARSLGVAHVLEGSVRKAGNQVRITAQLVKGSDGFHLWSETYDRNLENIFAIQDEIAQAVVDELKVKILGAAPEAVETNSQAYTLFLQAREVGRQTSDESLERSNALYRQVLEMDPNYAPAWGGLAANIVQQVTTGLYSQSEHLGAARQAAQRALEIDPEFAQAHATIGQIALGFDLDLAESARHLQKAFALEPGNIEVLRSVIGQLRALGRLDEALRVAEYMVELDPVNNHTWYNVGLMQRFRGNYDEAIPPLERAISLSPERQAAWSLIAESLMQMGDPEAALEAIQNENSVWRTISLPMIYHAAGRKAESDAALEKLVQDFPDEAAVNIAYNYAFLDEADLAFQWLDHAVKVSDPGLSDTPIDPLFENVRDDPRWLPFLEKLGKSPAQLDAIEFEISLPE